MLSKQAGLLACGSWSYAFLPGGYTSGLYAQTPRIQWRDRDGFTPCFPFKPEHACSAVGTCFRVQKCAYTSLAMKLATKHR